jgi:hypothetical protein
MAAVLWHDENPHLAVTIYDDAAAEILDKTSATRWRMGRVALQEDGPIDVGQVWLRTGRSICEQYPGRFHGERRGDHLRWTLLGRERQPLGQFTCELRLDGPWLELRISEIDETLPSLIFPPPIESESLVLPTNVGRWIRQPLPERHFWAYPAHLNMRWFGGLRGDHGWLALLDEGATDAGVLATGLALSPGWLKSLGRWTESRSVRYRCTSGGYVGLARAFRAEAIAAGWHRPLRDKLAATPALGNLLGGRMLAFMQAQSNRAERYEDRLQPVPPGLSDAGQPQVFVSHAQAAQAIVEAQQWGMTRGIVNLRGWISGGYDETHPDVWPPEPALGSLDELRRLVALPDPLLTTLHDNYQDIYRQSPSWPRGINRGPTGSLMAGGLWAGGQAYILNSRDSLAYARRNWEQIRTLGPRSMFIDTTIAVQLYESYEPGNELTRAQDQALKIELLRLYKQHGQVLGSEEGADWGVPWVDWIENRHRRIPGESIPLWPLVFHDAVLNLRYTSGPTQPESLASAAPNWLADMLWGYPLIWDVRDIGRWQTERAAFASTLDVDRWIARIGCDDMIAHRYLSQDGNLEQSEFASGVALLANFAAEPRSVDGVVVPAHGYVVRE